jgi:dihydrofolate reductase
MRKITILEHVSLDGIIQAPGGPEEDRDGGFAYGGWSAPHDDPAGGEAIEAAHGERFDLLIGRRTYDIWAGYWPQAEGPMADQINGATKYVATHRPESLAWGPAEAVGADLAAQVRRIKASAGPDLIVWGSSSLTSPLISEGLADEVILMIFPVLIGTGKRLFGGGAAPSELKLIRSRTGESGVMVNTYTPAGPMRTGSY